MIENFLEEETVWLQSAEVILEAKPDTTGLFYQFFLEKRKA